MTIRIGAVSYLNTKPLIYGLEDRLADVDLQLDLPSRLADQLSVGELDIALVPSVEFLRSDDWNIVSDACIACRGPVRSVQLLLRKAPQEVRSLALDEGSRTSAALAQILLAKRYGVRPKLQPLSLDSDYRAVDADACVVIGDRAMNIDSSAFVTAWDLGEEWNVTTGLPFVFAMWVAASPTPPEIAHALQSCRDLGIAHLHDIIAKRDPAYQLSAEDCRQYFTEHLHFQLGAAELAGLQLFRSYAVELGLIPETSNRLSLQPS